MKKILIIVATVFCFLFLSRALLHADIAPSPRSASEDFVLKEEHVDISISKDNAHVVANFTLSTDERETTPKPLVHCFIHPDVGKKCGKPYYQFEYSYPMLDGQEFTSFRASVDGQEVEVVKAEHRDKSTIPEAGHWIFFKSQRLTAEGVKFPMQTNIKIEYDEPIRFSGDKAKFTYVLRSGALWRGKIGKVDIVVKTSHRDLNYSIPPQTKAGEISIWRFEDFEPTEDLTITIRQR